MKVERRCILQGISLSDLKVKACLAYSHCLWNARLHFDLSILQIFSWVCTRPHAVCSYLTLFQATNLLSLPYRLSVQDIFFFFYFFFTCRSTCLNRPTAVYWGSCHFLSKQEDVMWGCECCGQVPGELSLQSNGVRHGSMTMLLPGKVDFFFLYLGGNWLLNTGLQAAERLDIAKMAWVR